MSFRIENDVIKLTRGDTAQFVITPYSSDGSEYELKDGDVVTFTVKKNTYDKQVLIQKTGLEVEIKPEETNDLTYGTYKYDVQMTFADGRIDTFIGPSDFVLTEEVTF
jgi:hypothetical protein